MGSRINCLFKFVVVSLVLVWGLVLGSLPCSAQTYNEIFRQKKTQEKYLLKQLAYLKMYAGYLKKGYDVVSDGLGTIKGFTSGEFGLHEAFFGSLALVNPLIKNDYRVMEIASMQGKISRAFNLMLRLDLGSENISYIRSVRDGVIAECNKDLDELQLVVSASELEISDEDRLLRLAKVHGSMSEKLEFVLGFYVEVQTIAQSQKDGDKTIQKLRRIYEQN
ncbi:hypothetical protein GM921_15030 [Pedobacter sp. LMG 31464]|uniref:TerB family tellurite resistance protein n=1 Tax=Pedobacter planticolens TaxID=2679964 RepID=A0A923E178_9SPHI|nr:hypothetical protein [Pedobacter planticolens]MBB2146815.1 hypothetical protein [Pedobacter planticolens]